MIQLTHVSFTHTKDLRPILEDFSLTLNKGDKAAIIGEEGNGKSTLLKWIYNPQLIEGYIECEGTRTFTNEVLGYLPQELPKEDRNKTIYEFFSEESMFFMLTPKEQNKLARMFGFDGTIFYDDTLLGSLSGGEKIKVQLLRLYMAQPTVLLLDEPSNDLDLETLLWLEEFIKCWNGIVLYISHDEMLVRNTANTIIHLEQIRRKTKSRWTVSSLDFDSYMKERLENYDTQLRLARDEKRQKAMRDAKLQRITQSVDSALTHISRADRDAVGAALKKKMHTVKAMERRYQREDDQATKTPEVETAIRIKQLHPGRRIPQGKWILDLHVDAIETPTGRVLSQDVNLQIRGPQKVVIVGKNGAGKTTLIKEIVSTLQLRDDIKTLYMPQDYYECLDESMNPVEHIAPQASNAERTLAQTFLGSLKFTPQEMTHPIGELSGGQRAKVYVLKMLLSDANVLILDEPTRNFSPLSSPELTRLLRDFDGAIICISHDRSFIKELGADVYELTADGLKERQEASW